MNTAINHLQSDPVLKPIILKYGILPVYSSINLFQDIVSSIVSQQLSVKAADTIWKRFIQLLPNLQVNPDNILSLEDDTIRSAGISYPKIKYIKDLSVKVKNQTVKLDTLKDMSDEEVIECLTQVKGIGRWTAQMLLMFSLNRPDVLPLEDLGIQTSFANLYKFERGDKEKMQQIAQQWIPYRTTACRYLWKALDNKV